MVAIFRSLSGENLEDFSVRLAQAWRVGQKGLDNGVIFLIFLDDRKMRLEVGYGLEAALTDATAGSIIRDVVAPRFREGRLADGIGAGLDAVQAAIAGTYAPPVGHGPGQGLDQMTLAWIVFLAFIGVPLLMLRFAAWQRRRYGWTGGRGGWASWSPGLGGSSRGGSGFSFSVSSSSSSSSDGFSSGGGSFGGGGASGGW